MKKLIFCITALMVLVACNNKSEQGNNVTANDNASGQSEMPVASPDDEGQTEWIKQTTIMSSKPMVIDFFATWCGPCKMLHPILEELSGELPETQQIAQLDIDQNVPLARKFGVMSVPTMIFFKNGKAIAKMVGLQEKQNIVDAFAQVEKM